jgi:hypothetical protein
MGSRPSGSHPGVAKLCHHYFVTILQDSKLPSLLLLWLYILLLELHKQCGTVSVIKKNEDKVDYANMSEFDNYSLNLDLRIKNFHPVSAEH